MNPLITTVLDLDHALGPNAGLLLGGGLGLYLKQEYLRRSQMRTLLPLERLPQARTTQDIDLFLRAEVIASKEAVSHFRHVLNSLGFEVVPGAEWLKFRRPIAQTEVLLDVMVGPLGAFAAQVTLRDSRVRPKGLGGKTGLHAFATREALGIEVTPMPITVSGTRSNGQAASCEVLIPQAFPYALMKLGALRDRVHDSNKQEGRHHAMDLYRIVGMLTEEELETSSRLADEHGNAPEVVEAHRTVDILLAPSTGLGRIRLLEYQRMNLASTPAVDVDFLVRELRRLLTPVKGR